MPGISATRYCEQNSKHVSKILTITKCRSCLTKSPLEKLCGPGLGSLIQFLHLRKLLAAPFLTKFMTEVALTLYAHLNLGGTTKMYRFTMSTLVIILLARYVSNSDPFTLYFLTRFSKIRNVCGIRDIDCRGIICW
jgi:hypothetical protein